MGGRLRCVATVASLVGAPGRGGGGRTITLGAIIVADGAVDGAQIVKDYNTAFSSKQTAWFFTDATEDPSFVQAVGANNFTFQHEGTGSSAPTGRPTALCGGVQCQVWAHGRSGDLLGQRLRCDLSRCAGDAADGQGGGAGDPGGDAHRL